MYSASQHNSGGEYRYCPERSCEVTLRGTCTGVGGMRFSIRGAKIRIGYFFRVFGLIGKSVRRGLAGLRRVVRNMTKTGFRSMDVRQALCCARL